MPRVSIGYPPVESRVFLNADPVVRAAVLAGAAATWAPRALGDLSRPAFMTPREPQPRTLVPCTSEDPGPSTVPTRPGRPRRRQGPALGPLTMSGLS